MSKGIFNTTPQEQYLEDYVEELKKAPIEITGSDAEGEIR